MNIPYTASAILRGKWLIEPNFAESQGPIIAGLLNNKLEFEQPEEDKFLAYAVPAGSHNIASRYSLKYDSESIPENSVVVIPLKGALMKASQMCGPMGMAEIGELIKKADAHKNVVKIILHIDSPGGTVDGTEALGNIILACETKTIAFVDGMMCSAALWIGSCCDEIIASTDTDEIGSVGVLLSFMDIQPYWESLGVKFHTITASTSPDKVQRWKKLQAGEYDEYRKEVLDPIDEKFMNLVKNNRPGVKDEHLTGLVYLAKNVLGVFVDDFGTLDQIISESISGSGSGSASAINNKNKNSMEKLTALVAIMAVANLELEADKDGGLYMNAEELEAFNTALENSDVKKLGAELETATAAQQTAEKSLATANERIAELEKQLDEKPGAESAKANKETDAKKATETVDDEFDNLAEASDLYNSIK